MKLETIHLKAQSEENERKCWAALDERASEYPKVILIDATRTMDDDIHYRVYMGEDSGMLMLLGWELLYCPSIRDEIAGNAEGRSFHYLDDGSELASHLRQSSGGMVSSLPEDEMRSDDPGISFSSDISFAERPGYQGKNKAFDEASEIIAAAHNRSNWKY